MIAFIVRRLLFLPLLWLAITFIIFLCLEPLGPYQRVTLFINISPESFGRGGKLTQEQLQRLIDKYGLADPAPIQYGRWLKQIIFDHNFGWSKVAQKPVIDALLERLPATTELALYAIIPVVFVAIWLGVISAVHHNRPLDHITRFVSITGYSIPIFVFGIFMLMYFYGVLQWFPPGRNSLWAERIIFASHQFIRYTGLNTVDALLNQRLDILVDSLRHLALPVLTLAYLNWAALLRVTRSSMLETLRQDYITTARAKGLPENVVVQKHAKRNALIPVTTISANIVAGLIGGVVITETIFNYKGVGIFSLDATLQFDIPTVLGVALFGTTLIVITNLVVDILYAIIDPRVRYD
ncbi:ABC transporter permease [Candidatus Acetothermia bacterium]|nr:ABC transporter permease [Candidatus Acetothermia bacterium]